MKHTQLFVLFLTSMAISAQAGEVETHFLELGDSVFEAKFDDNDDAPAKPAWFLRKSSWTIKAGVLRGVNDGGAGPFIHLHSKEKGGPLPEDYIMNFSFRIEENPDKKNPTSIMKPGSV